MPHLTLPDICLHYQVTGTGPALMLIPGMLSDHASWTPLVPLLEGSFTLIMPDPRGAGQTQPMDAPITLAALADDMLALADHLGHLQFSVMGHSMGGLVTLALAGRAQNRVNKVVLLASTPLPSARIPEAFRLLCQLRSDGPEDLWLRQLFTWLFHDRFFRDPQAVDDTARVGLAYPHLQSLTAMQHQTAALARLDIGTLPQTITQPGLALMGDEDALIAPGPASRRLMQMGLTVQTVPKTAHSLHWDAPEVVAQRAIDFLLGAH